MLAAAAVSLFAVFQFLRDGWEYRSGGGPEAYREGYTWAKEHRVTDWRRCPTEPEKRHQGCVAYVEQEAPAE